MAALVTKLIPDPLFPGHHAGSNPDPDGAEAWHPGSALHHDRPRSATDNTLRASRSIAVLADLTALWCAALFAIVLRFPLGILHDSLGKTTSATIHSGFLLLYSGLVVLFCNTQQLYTAYTLCSSRWEALALTRAVSMATVLLIASVCLSGVTSISRLVIAVTMFTGLLGMFGWRQFRRRWVRKAIAEGFTGHHVAIVGAGPLARSVESFLRANRDFGYRVVGSIALAGDTALAGCLGTVDQLASICRANFVDEIIVCAPDPDCACRITASARDCRVAVRLIPEFYGWGAPIDYLGPFPSISLLSRNIPAGALIVKRVIDICASAAILTVLAPLLLMLAAAIAIDSRGPIFYSSHRVGRKGRVFGCYKFRTMVANADGLKAQLSHLNERDGVLFKIANDPRITRLGRVLRKYSLDELPQFWNVLKGDMSIVGPRPPLADEVKKYELEYLRRLEVAPGITGLWQVEARANPSFDRYIALDLQYIENWSLFMDLKILARTVAVVMAGTGQ
jgi:exopolysaccharide biosynthesis polyprenyl glycosylphosphotransferase